MSASKASQRLLGISNEILVIQDPQINITWYLRGSVFYGTVVLTIIVLTSPHGSFIRMLAYVGFKCTKADSKQ